MAPRLITPAEPALRAEPARTTDPLSNDSAMNPSHCIRLAFVLVCLALAGCVETRFESPLGDHLETCDARWKGLWTGADSDLDLGHDVTAFHVNEDCEFSVLDQPEAGGALKHIHVPLNYVHVDNRDYIVIADTALAGLVKLKAPHGIDPVPPKSFFFARYQVRGERIALYPVDDAEVARLVIDGKLDGTVDKSRNELRVYVRGSRAQMLALVRGHEIFTRKPTLELVRSRKNLAEFERSLQQPAKAVQ